MMFHIGASFVSLAPIFYKSQSALILLLLLSKSQPLALGCDLVCRLTDGFDRPASFSSTHDKRLAFIRQVSFFAKKGGVRVYASLLVKLFSMYRVLELCLTSLQSSS